MLLSVSATLFALLNEVLSNFVPNFFVFAVAAFTISRIQVNHVKFVYHRAHFALKLVFLEFLLLFWSFWLAISFFRLIYSIVHCIKTFWNFFFVLTLGHSHQYFIKIFSSIILQSMFVFWTLGINTSDKITHPAFPTVYFFFDRFFDKIRWILNVYRISLNFLSSFNFALFCDITLLKIGWVFLFITHWYVFFLDYWLIDILFKNILNLCRQLFF